ncbi:MAG: redoxin domain-containing protein [Phycisphaerae bacterium]|nr:redoxin domain-containing protein [Phycisphaerae bacterium]
MLTHTIAAFTCVATLCAAAQEPEKLKVGSAMPSLDNVEIIQGSKDNLTDAKVTVVEFWATWCGPCVKAIPHINEFAKANSWRGLRVLGVSTDSTEDKSKVEPFIKKMGSRMTYNVGWAGDGVSRDWMEASGQKGIPCAFVCTNGKIAWIGHPMDDGFESTIRKCLSGRFDPELSPKGEQYLEAGRGAAKKRNWREASKHFDDCIALKPEIFVDAMEAKYQMLADQQKDAAAAKSWATEVTDKLSSSPVALAEFAVFVAHDPRLQQHDLESAQSMIEAAMAAGGTKTDVLVSAARVASAAGKLDAAVELQNKAWRQASPEQKPFLKTDLDAYKQSQAKGASAKVGQ